MIPPKRKRPIKTSKAPAIAVAIANPSSPYPIVVGFTSGIALTIFTTQIKDLLGLTVDKLPADCLSQWAVYFQHLDSINPISLLIGVGSILIIAVMPKISRKIPGSLVAIIVMTAVAYLLKEVGGISGIETIGDRFNISNEIPEPQPLHINMETINQLLSPAFTIAILCAIESLLSATVADGAISEHHNSNTELIGQGVANIVVPFFGGIPVTGAIARTMTNINNGGRTPVAGIIHALVLLAIFLLLMPLIELVPMACLAYRTLSAAESQVGYCHSRHDIYPHGRLQPHHRHRNRYAAGCTALPAPRLRKRTSFGTERRTRCSTGHGNDPTRDIKHSQRRGSI